MSTETMTCACRSTGATHDANCPTQADQARANVEAAALVVADLARDGALLVNWVIDARAYDSDALPVLDGQVDGDAPDPMAVLEAYARRWGTEVRDRFAGYEPHERITFCVKTVLRGIHVRVWARIEPTGEEA